LPRYRFGRVGYEVDFHINADSYTTAEGQWVTFYRDKSPILSLPSKNVAMVAELDDGDELPFDVGD